MFGIADDGIIDSRADVADIFLRGWIARLFHLFDRLEIVFADAADGADPTVGQIFERRSGRNAVFGIADGGIIDGGADVADVFLHFGIIGFRRFDGCGLRGGSGGDVVQSFKIGGGMLAERADEIRREFIAFIDIAADFADPAFLLRGGLLRLDVVLIVGIGHGVEVGKRLGFRHAADEHAVGAEIDVVFDFQGIERIAVVGKDGQAVGGTGEGDIGELVVVAATAETEVLEDGERRGFREDIDVHDAALLDDVMGVVGLVDGDGDLQRFVGHLHDGIADHAVVAISIVRRDDIEAIGDFEEGVFIDDFHEKHLFLLIGWMNQIIYCT